MNTGHFSIDDVDCFIGRPSDMFVLLNKDIEDNFFDVESWNTIYTLTMIGVTRDNFKDYLQQALFLISYCNPPFTDGDYPTIGHNSIVDYSEEEINTNIIDTNFDKAEYLDAINFYNAGSALGESLYFYKVIEHFFIVNRKKEILDLISSERNSDDLVEKITKIYKDDELSCLEYLLNNKFIYDRISIFIKAAYDEGEISEDTVEKFAEKLYNYRNSIVHGKNDKRLEIRTVDILNSDNDIWHNLVKGIAKVCIDVFCFKNSLRSHVE